MFQRIKTKYPIIVLSILILISFLLAFINVRGDSFTSRSKDWSNLDNIVTAAESNTYPYNSDNKNIVINSVGMDVLYGSRKPLVAYAGELPESAIKNDDGDYVDNFSGMYSVNGTSLSCDNTHKGGTSNNGISAYDYWGFDDCSTCQNSILPLSNGKATLNDMEQVNGTDEGVISLRLNAASNYSSSFAIKNIIYGGLNFVSLAAVFILSLLLTAKNLDTDIILKILRLDNLVDTFRDTFIFNSTTGKLSVFTAFCIIMLLFSLVAYAIRYAKGQNKTDSFLNIILRALLGVLIIGMCLTGRISTLGSSVSNITSKLLYAVAGSLSSNYSGKTFLTDIIDNENENKVIQLQEMSLINKTYIDLQICGQFNVDDIEELNIKNLGDSNGAIAKSTWANLDGVDIKENFSNNLGYYFWFADTSAINKTDLNIKYPETNSAAIRDKMSSVETYLQKCYNNARENNNSTTKTEILKISNGLACPNAWVKLLNILLFIAILVLLMLCLFKYGVNVVIAKIELFFALLGLTIAGPLMITNKKGLVEKGKVILGMLLVNFINVTVYSIVFDLILYIVASICSGGLVDEIVTLVLLIFLFKFNPYIQEAIKKMLENTERTISPAYNNAHRGIKNWSRKEANKLVNSYDNSSKIVGYDENGNAITERRKGNALSRAMHQAQNNVFNDGAQRESNHKIRKDGKTDLKNSKAQTRDAKRKAADASVKNTEKVIANQAEATKKTMEKKADELRKDIYTEDEQGIEFDTDKLTQDELSSKNTIDELTANIESIKENSEYKDLLKQKHDLAQENKKLAAEGKEQKEMDAEANEKLLSYQAELSSYNLKKKSEIKKLKAEIDERTARQVIKQYGLEGKAETLDEAAKFKAQADNDTALRKALRDQINFAAEDANKKITGKKIGSKDVANKEALTTQAAAMYRMKELDEGLLISSEQEAKEEVKKAVDMVVQNNDKTLSDPNIQAAKAQYIETSINPNLSRSDKREMKKQNRKDINDATNQHVANLGLGKQNHKLAKEEHGRLFKATTSMAEQMSTAVGQLDVKKKKNNQESRRQPVNYNKPNGRGPTGPDPNRPNPNKPQSNSSNRNNEDYTRNYNSDYYDSDNRNSDYHNDF